MREDLEALRMATVEAALRGEGELPSKVRDRAYEVTDRDLDALRARYSDDQLFEAVVAMVLGAAETRLRAGLRALEGA